jgi:two-component system chemotaxis response regulator CheY
MRKIVKQMLSQSGLEVVGEAMSGSQALEQYKALLPDIVTMDMVLPDMDGISAVKAIVSDFPQAAIVICTSMDQQALVFDMIGAGAKAFVRKPFTTVQIVEKIEQLLAQRKSAARS